MSFRYRLALFLVGTLVAVQVLTAVFAYSYLRQSFVERAKAELLAEAGIFTRQLEFLSERVTDAVKVLSLDYALRAAIARQDRSTELSALRNHGERIGAARMMLLDLRGRISADTLAPASWGGAFMFPELLDGAGQDKAAALVAFHKRIYWIVVVPVRAPIPIAFIAAFVPVDASLLERLRSISAEPRAIMLATETAGKWQVAAQSRLHLTHIAFPIGTRAPMSAVEQTEGKDQYLTIISSLPVARASSPIVVILSYPLTEAFATYRAIVVPILLVLGVALVAAVSGAMLVVRGVSRPLESLAAAAGRIAVGDYSEPPKITQRDEIGHLADTLSNMRRSIAERENALRGAVEATEAARNDAVRANKAKSQFLANMSHELRTPLNAILGFSEILERQVLGPLGVPKYRDYVRDIRQSGNHLLGLVERMLDLAGAESNRLVVSRSPVRPTELLKESVVGLRPFAERCGVRLMGPEASVACLEIDGDPARLRQAFINIIHNALKFTPVGGDVRVSSVAGSQGLAIQICDTGIGMDSEALAHVVRPFHRLRSALDGQHQGAGVGLPFAKSIIELHGGSFSIQSALGIGTTVLIVFPVSSTISRAA